MSPSTKPKQEKQRDTNKNRTMLKTVARPVELYVFIRPNGSFRPPLITGPDPHPGILVPDVLLRLAAAARGQTFVLRKGTPGDQIEPLWALLRKLYRRVTRRGDPRDLAQIPMTSSCYDKTTHRWTPGNCVSAVMELRPSNYHIDHAPNASWEVLVSVEVSTGSSK